MKPYLLKVPRILILCSFFLLTGLTGYAQLNRGILIKSVLDGAAGQLTKDSVADVQDKYYFDANKSKLDTPYLVRNSITLRINEFSGLYLPATFSATVNVRIYYTAPNLSKDSTDQVITVDYDTTHPYQLRNSFVFTQAHQVKVKVLSVTTNASKNIIPALILENEMTVYPVYKLDCIADAIKRISSNNPPNTDSTDEIVVSWDAVTGADVYDLEWAYVDSSALESNRYGIPLNPSLVFENNTTRVTIAGNSYAVPLLYDKVGVLYYRVRAVQEKSNDVRIETAWSSDYTEGLGHYTFGGHQNRLNWQSSISFAEDGKRKVVVQYYDGSLRGRQTATKDNTTNKTVVAESLYDYQGRPVIQLLPAPTLNNVLKYTRNLNSAINGGEYDKSKYDHIDQPSEIITASAAQMSTAAGANQYYSPANPEKNTGVNQYLPDAQGYAFTETVLTPDNTGRISRQGGVGPDFKIGSNHEIKYYYGDAEQESLDALFGTEVGISSHYKKNVVEDANGQLSVSYVDMHGRTIATALAGEAWNKSLEDVPEKEVIPVTDSLSGPGKTFIRDRSLVTNHSTTVLMDGTYKFNYELDPPVLTKVGCDEHSTSYVSLYDLQIRITDDVWNQHMPGKVPFDTVLHNYTPALQVAGDGKLSLEFSLFLVKGTYNISKILSVSHVAMEYYRDSIFLKNNICTSYETIRENQLIKQRQSLCEPVCGDCEDPQHTEGDDIRSMMLQDMSPPSGQYALLSDSMKTDYSIFYRNNTTPAYKRTDIKYLDANGQEARVLSVETNTFVIPQDLSAQQFADEFQPSWAEALLPLHPEYCKLGYLQADQMKQAQLWEKDFSATDTYFGAKQKGYLFPTATTNPDPLISYRRAELIAGLTKYKAPSGAAMTLLGMAVAASKCGETASCFEDYKALTPEQAEASMCAADLDMAWRNFRSLYLNIHREQSNNYINSSCNAARGVAANIAAAGKQPQFITPDLIMRQTGAVDIANGVLGQTGNEQATRDAAQQAVNQVYYNNIDSLANTWLKQLAPCKYTDVALGEIKTKLLSMCKASADADHPYGASTLKPGASNAYSSFQAILAEYNNSHQITDPLICNGELITFPKPYNNQPALASNYSYKKPQECECNNLSILNAQYLQNKKPGDANFSVYLQRTRGVKIAQTDLDDLLAACSSSSSSGCDYLPRPVKIPALIQCSIAPPCVNCAVTDSLYHQFTTAYPGITPVADETAPGQQQKNKLFEAFMNNRLGFSEKTATYLEFLDSCHNSANQGTRVCVKTASTQRQVVTYSNGGQDTITDIRAVTDGFIMAGATTGCSAGKKDAYIIKTDASGQLQWSKTYGGDEDEEFRRLIPTSDSGYIAIGTTRSYCFPQGAMMVVRIDASGGVIWNKTVDFGEANGAKGCDIVQTDDGNFAIAGLRTTGATNTEWVTGVLSANGELVWLKQTGAGDAKDMISLVASNDTLVAGTSMNNQTGRMPVLFKQDLKTGAPLLMMQYQPAGATGNYVVNNLIRTTTGYKMVVTGSNNTESFIDVDNSGAIVSMRQQNGVSGAIGQTWTASATLDGGVISASSSQDVWWSKWSADNVLSWGSHVQLSGDDKVYKVVQRSDSSYGGAGMYNGRAMLMLANKEGKSGCDDKPETLSVSTNVPGVILMAAQASQYLSYNNINTVAITDRVCTPLVTAITCPGIDSCFMVYDGLLCGNAVPAYQEDPLTPVTACADSLDIADNKAREIYNAIRDSVMNDFESTYLSKSMAAISGERFAVSYNLGEYHYTLYYYDQAGNLVKTVPPAGVVRNRSRQWLDSVQEARKNGVALTPVHKLETEYRYNTLNNVVEQKTPDAGTSRFWYDRLGRIAISQNSKQLHPVTGPVAYSYTLYDYIGRITEVGEINNSMAITDAISRDPVALSLWIQGGGSSRSQITRTVYDQPYNFVENIGWKAKNLRNRVSWSGVYNNIADTVPGGQAAATYYSYDIHGNVSTLLQDYNPATEDNNGNRWKEIRYTYDLVSGKVNTVSYQPGKVDAYYHRYNYDAENRIINVETSRDSLYWENDAYYQYYKHGALARSVIGQAQVQGMDYAYNLQGWMKGANSTGTNDMGHDGASTGLTAKDVFGYSLYYYGDNDYTPISTSRPFAVTGSTLKPLFNGNISGISLNLPKVGEPLLYAYKYDVLNRLTGMNANRGLDQGSNTWTPVTVEDFKENISYDPNGNILTYNRNGNETWANKPRMMDALTYHYTPGTNKLSSIDDAIAPGQYDNDIDAQEAGNYKYDSIGNLIADKEGKLDSIVWNLYGKISRIRKSDNTLIIYKYDVAGNRISKIAGNTETRYVRDATGNVMSVYVSGNTNINNGLLSQIETHLYGSSRLGIDTRVIALQNDAEVQNTRLTGVGDGRFVNFMRGYKFFELSNHLGNVLATVSDEKMGVSTDGNNIDRYEARVISAQDYAPFGMGLTGRGFDVGKYRYGFNGKENDNEVKGAGNQYDYGFRIYDPRIARFLSVDPLTQTYPWYTPYQFAGNKPIVAVDLDGLEELIVHQYFNQGKVSKIEIMRYTDVNGQLQNNQMTRLSDGYKIAGNVLTFNHRGNNAAPEVVEQDQLTKTQQDVLNKNLSVRSFSYKNGGHESFSSSEYDGREYAEGNFIKSSGTIEYPVPAKPKPRPVLFDDHHPIRPGVTLSDFKGSNNYYIGVSNFPSAGDLGDEMKGSLSRLGKSIDQAGNIKTITVSLTQVVGSDITAGQYNEAVRQANVALGNIINTLDKDTKSKVKIVNGGATVLRSNNNANKIKDAGTHIKLQ
ncbi:RHS repeat-associated protein [Chitinophaga sp. W3I9]|uniref:RHS repeat domain-containing protein n=1 Tax=Chitinophaga sp. W3I9 TaxID=3373924 RepID=UPI003D1F4E78